MKGRLFVVSGPSGSGKSTITKIVRDKLNIPLSISATSRKSRKGEIDGVDYYFLTEEEFKKKIENNEFFEYANVHGNYYGTLLSEIDKKLENGRNVILEIDVQGAIISKSKYQDITLVFCKTENLDELKNRLLGRNTDSSEVIEKRLQNAKKELDYEKFYDYVIINKDLDDSVNKLIKIIKGECDEKK